MNLSSELWRMACVWAASVALIFTDVLGVGDAQRRISEELFYDVAAVALEPARRPPIVAVLATDGDLAELGAAWPLPHDLQAEVLAEIAAYGPAAVFVDILFLDIRDAAAADALLRAIGEFDGKIVLASPWDGDSAPPPPQSLAFYEAAQNLGAVIADARFEKVEGAVITMRGGGGDPPPAGLAMRDIYCPDADCAALEKNRATPTELAWRGTPAACAANDDSAPDACGKIPRWWAARLGARLAAGVFPSLAAQPLARQGLLPYETVTVSDILLAADPGAELAGAVVFYGQSFRAASDVAESSVYGPVPGVMAHAAHFDDLVSRGDRKFSPARPFGLASMQYEAALIALLCAVMLVARVLLQTRARRLITDAKDGLSDARLHALTAIAVGAAAILVLGFECTVLRTTPEHWLIAFGVIALDTYVPWMRVRNGVSTRLDSIRRLLFSRRRRRRPRR